MKNIKTKNVQKFTIGMKKKLVVLFMLVLLAFAGLGARLISITTNNGKEYEKKVLSQQQYDSRSIAYKRGSILDCNESTLAWSEKVYDLILNANVLVSDDAEVTLLTIYDKNEIENVSDEYIQWLVSEAQR